MVASSIPQPPCQWRRFGIKVAHAVLDEHFFGRLAGVIPSIGAFAGTTHRIEVSGCHDGKAATS